jgi:hypothetical protein
MFLRNIGSYKNHTASHPRIWPSSKPIISLENVFISQWNGSVFQLFTNTVGVAIEPMLLLNAWQLKIGQCCFGYFEFYVLCVSIPLINRSGIHFVVRQPSIRLIAYRYSDKSTKTGSCSVAKPVVTHRCLQSACITDIRLNELNALEEWRLLGCYAVWLL